MNQAGEATLVGIIFMGLLFLCSANLHEMGLRRFYQVFQCVFNPATVWRINVELLPFVTFIVVPFAGPIAVDADFE